MTSRSLPLEKTRHRARVAYELARLRIGALRGLILTTLVSGAAFLSFGETGLGWLTFTLVAWTVLEWRGGVLLRGGRIGAGVGLAVLVVPHWAFRTCCHAGDAMMGAGCCNMTSACTTIGVVLGLTLAVFLARTTRAERVESAAGMGVALLAVASVRCATLLAGEALGLMGGLAAGALASSLVAALVDRARRLA
jgi:hypothetical protein